MILIYRFSDPNDVKIATTVLENSLDSYWPYFETRDDVLFVSSRIDPRKGISIGRQKDTALVNLDCINSLTLSQRHCLLFLIISVLSHQFCIIQGATASGKSHLVRLFARLLGKKLITIQLNGDIGISSLTGQFLPHGELSDMDIAEIRAVLTGFPDASSLNRDIASIISIDDPATWSPPRLKNVLSLLARFGAETVDADAQQRVLEVLNVIRAKMSFLHHLWQEDSAFIKALKQGD
jgi:hypothetical protein